MHSVLRNLSPAQRGRLHRCADRAPRFIHSVRLQPEEADTEDDYQLNLRHQRHIECVELGSEHGIWSRQARDLHPRLVQHRLFESQPVVPARRTSTMAICKPRNGRRRRYQSGLRCRIGRAAERRLRRRVSRETPTPSARAPDTPTWKDGGLRYPGFAPSDAGLTAAIMSGLRRFGGEARSTGFASMPRAFRALQRLRRCDGGQADRPLRFLAADSLSRHGQQWLQGADAGGGVLHLDQFNPTTAFVQLAPNSPGRQAAGARERTCSPNIP